MQHKRLSEGEWRTCQGFQRLLPASPSAKKGRGRPQESLRFLQFLRAISFEQLREEARVAPSAFPGLSLRVVYGAATMCQGLSQTLEIQL